MEYNSDVLIKKEEGKSHIILYITIFGVLPSTYKTPN